MKDAVPLWDVVFHIERALDGMLAAVTALDDVTANRRAEFPGANTPYALVVHCCGVLEFWAGQVIAGRTIERDREAEFFATGAVAELGELVRGQLERFRTDLAAFDGGAAPVGPLRPRDIGLEYTRTQGGCLMHIHEEVAQHRGQLDVTVDVLNSVRP